MDYGKLFELVTKPMVAVVLAVAVLVSLIITVSAAFGDGCISGEYPFKFRLGCRDQIAAGSKDALSEQVKTLVSAAIAKMQPVPGPKGDTGAKGDIGLAGADFLAPPDAIVAFDSPQCPPGWTAFQKGWSRFLIGASTSEQLAAMPARFFVDSRTEKLEPRPFGDPGGEQRHKLTISELPPHSHKVNGVTSDAGGSIYPMVIGSTYTVSAETSVVGDGVPHNIIPPYIAVQFCVKSKS